MINRQRLAMWIIVAALSLPAYADRASDAYNHGVRAERQQNYDGAYEYYKQAHTIAPNDGKYLAAYTRMRFNAAMQHVRTARTCAAQAPLPQAMAEFRHAVEIDSSSFLAQDELRHTADMIQRQEQQRSAPKVEPPVPKLADEDGKTVELQPLSNAPITLHMTVNADAAYKTICKTGGTQCNHRSGLQAAEDFGRSRGCDHPRSVGHGSPPVENFWLPVLANTIFVAADSAAKRKDLEQNVMRTFYLQNISTAAELTEAANLLRQILEITHVQLLAGQGALVLRGTPDQMVLAEKLLTDIDKPNPRWLSTSP